MPPDPLTTLAGQFADEVWPRTAKELLDWQPDFAAECARHGISVHSVCEAQTDETLALAFQKGVFTDAVFVELLVVRYGTKLSDWFVRHGRRYSRSVGEELVNELMQELWYRLFANRLAGYDPTRVFGSFLFVVSRNLFIQRIIRSRHGGPLPEWDDPSCADTVGLEVEFREMNERLETALGQLSSEYQEVLRLTLTGHTPEQIAGMLGISVQVVYRRLFAARRAVERELSG